MCFICRNNVWDDTVTRQLHISCSEIETIPVFTNTDFAMFENCDNLLYIPPMPRLTSMYIIDCNLLYRINPSPNLTKLYIWNTSIVTIPSIPNLEILYIDSCNRFLKMGEMPSLISLSIIKCPNARLPSADSSPVIFDLTLDSCNMDSIPSYPMLSHLWLNSMHRLSHIPQFENLEFLSIKNCFLIASIPSILSLTRIIIHGTGGFFNLPDVLHLLERLELMNLWIRNIPNYPQLNSLSCFNCPMLDTIHHNNYKSLTLVDCPKITALPCPLSSLDYFRCDEKSPLRVYARFFLPSSDFTPEEQREFIGTTIRLCFLQNKFRQYNYNRRARQFLSLCYSEPFCRQFWNPDGMGGRWHIRKMQGFTRQLRSQLT
jgi:hypothetical protein